MKHVPLSSFILLMILLIQACTPVDNGPNTKVDRKGGYKNLKLDAPFDSLKNLAELHQTLDNQCTATRKFKITTQPFTSISTINFDNVELEFVRDSLYRIILHRGYDYQTDSQLHQLYRAEFGEPSEERKTIAGSKYTTYKWVGTKSYIYIIQRDHADLDLEYGSFRGMHRSLEEAKKCSQRKLQGVSR